MGFEHENEGVPAGSSKGAAAWGYDSNVARVKRQREGRAVFLVELNSPRLNGEGFPPLPERDPKRVSYPTLCPQGPYLQVVNKTKYTAEQRYPFQEGN